MDGIRFDTLTRGLAATLPRRAVGRLLTGLGVAGVLTPLTDLTPMAAKKRRKGRGKGKGKKKKPTACPEIRQCGAGCCPKGKVCGSNGACVDPTCCSGEAICGKHTSVGRICCVAPRVAECCCDSESGVNDGFVRCCEPGVDCHAGCPHIAEKGTAGLTGGPPDADGICIRAGDALVSCTG